MKKLFIVALSAGALYLLYTAYKKSKEEKPKEVTPPDEIAEMPPKEPPFMCPEGEILCAAKEKTCYNPAANYIVDPCS